MATGFLRKNPIHRAEQWFASKKYQPFRYQLEAWQAFLDGQSGLINAPTGSGKTYSLMVPIILESLEAAETKGIQAIWIAPIRSLSREIVAAGREALQGLGSSWQIESRTGDTPAAARARMKQTPPQILVTTPESLSLLLSYTHAGELLGQVRSIVVDEWHELIGSKRGVQMELVLSRLLTLNPALRIWGISATIGNLEEAMEVLNEGRAAPMRLIRADIQKKIHMETLLPDGTLDTYPWAGHLGLALLEKTLPLIQASQSTLIFTNTRAQCEIWYQRLLEVNPDLAGLMAMHHSSMDSALREWVENGLDTGTLWVVVSTSSLDLGVDFRAVDTIIQIGSPKGIARYVQRAGRSGHRPGETSRIYFLPTHSLEVLEAAALQQTIQEGLMESKPVLHRCFDVLVQHLITLSLGDGLDLSEAYREVSRCYSFQYMEAAEWEAICRFLHTGGSLEEYEEYRRLIPDKSGKWRIATRGQALRHRLNIGTIAGDQSLTIQFVKGPALGTVEEWFLMQLKPGDHFWFAGRALELVAIRDNKAQVRKSKATRAKVPAWMGGRMPLSSPLADRMRLLLQDYLNGQVESVEMQALRPLLEQQRRSSALPAADELLIESFESREGHHLILYPFEGRLVHEGLAALLAFRLSGQRPVTVSIAMNDYGLELLSDQPMDQGIIDFPALFSTENLRQDITASMNVTEMARRRFRDIASISGLIFRGYPGREKRERHLQSSSSMLFQVFRDYEPDHLLYLQAFEEVLQDQLEENRLRACLERMQKARIIRQYPDRFTPFAFPIIVDRLRESMSTEKLEERIRKMRL
jgi:ATP-dependent helicase Lhr and Lhr-like helicase